MYCIHIGSVATTVSLVGFRSRIEIDFRLKASLRSPFAMLTKNQCFVWTLRTSNTKRLDSPMKRPETSRIAPKENAKKNQKGNNVLISAIGII